MRVLVPPLSPAGPSTAVRQNSTKGQLVGAWTFWLFAFAFPLVSGAERIECNDFKFYGLAVTAAFLAVVNLRTLAERDSFQQSLQKARVGLLLAAILEGYSLFLCGLTTETTLIAILAPTILLLSTDHFQQCLRSHRNLFILVTGYVILTTASCFFSHQQYASILGHPYRHTGLSTLLACFIIFWSALHYLRTDEYRRFAVKLFLTSAFFITVIALVQFFFIREEWLLRIFPPLREDARPYGTLGHPNWFGTYLLLLLPFAIHFLLVERRWHWRVLVALLHASLLVCQTRGAWLAEGVLLIFTAWMWRRESKRLLELGCILGVVTAMLLPTHHWRILKRADSLGREAELAAQGSSGAGTGRFGFWKYAIGHLPEHVFLGAGLDSFDAMADDGERAPVSKAHSIYLDHGLSSGLIGLGLYLAFLWKCFWTHPPPKLRLAFRGMLLAYLVQGLFIHDTIQTWPLLWMLAGIAIGSVFKEQEVSPTVSAPAESLVLGTSPNLS